MITERDTSKTYYEQYLPGFCRRPKRSNKGQKGWLWNGSYSRRPWGYYEEPELPEHDVSDLGDAEIVRGTTTTVAPANEHDALLDTTKEYRLLRSSVMVPPQKLKLLQAYASRGMDLFPNRRPSQRELGSLAEQNVCRKVGLR